ncbi:uncharacterized protein LOC132200603 [Neocloeon triangulifer]|uniref:uncharacterized protein LOC132200603 n=1 Tax=Neocloeon triangulifer TaxID=2078957 RepID=UPI00286F0091|nr:uncharacterized protein LOC132200603 [Neocloeon triangulifer]
MGFSNQQWFMYGLPAAILLSLIITITCLASKNSALQEIAGDMIIKIQDVQKENDNLTELLNKANAEKFVHLEKYDATTRSIAVPYNSGNLNFGCNLKKKYKVESEAFTTKTLENGKKYYFSKKSLSWWDATLNCAFNCMVLAAPKTKIELALLNNATTANEKRQHWWVAAANHAENHLEFSWIDGTPLSTESELWRKNPMEPNEYKNASIAACAMIFSGELVDDPCEKAWGHICE